MSWAPTRAVRLVFLLAPYVGACGGSGDPLPDGSSPGDGTVVEDARRSEDGAVFEDASASDSAVASDGSTVDADAPDPDGSVTPTAVCRFRVGGAPAIHEAATSFIVSGSTASVMCNSEDRSLRVSIVGDTLGPGSYRCTGSPSLGSVTMVYDGGGTSYGANISAGSRDAPCVVTLDELGTRARGTFEAMLDRVIGTDPPDTLDIIEGEFDLPVSRP